VDFLKAEKVAIPENILDPLYKASEISSEETVSTPPESLRGKAWVLLKAYWLFILVAAFGVLWLVLSYFAGSVGFLASTKAIFKYLFSFTAVIAIFKPILEKVLDESMSKIFQSILPWSEVRTKVEKEERLNSPEQFETLFNKLIEAIGEKEKIVIVFDNIDRVQGDVAIKTLSTIKTFLDPLQKSNVIFIVPCDADAIVQQIRSFYGKDLPEGEEFDPSEYLRKLFNIVIYTPEFIDADLEAYTKQLLGQTGAIKDLLLDDDVVFVISKAFPNNPREIKQFINNLIAMVVVASKTEVNDLIVQKGKIAYLAKVLVLKQKFPKAYARLKEKWYEPDNILSDGDDAELTDFLTATSPITTDDAEPYIYFKKPTVVDNISDLQPIRQYLLNADEKGFTSVFTSEGNKESVVDYVMLLLNRYTNQHDPLFNIFTTQLAVFAANSASVTKRNYFDESLKILDNQLWPDYLRIPTDLVFSFLLSNASASKALKSKIIDRYILALAGEQLKQQPEFLSALLKNFIKHEDLVSSAQKSKVSEAIEQGYGNNINVFNLFSEGEQQETYISQKALEQFISSMSLQNFTSKTQTILNYKAYIQKLKLSSLVLKKLQELVGIETATTPDYSPQKETFVTELNKLLTVFSKDIKALAPEEKQSFGLVFVQAFNAITTWDNRSVWVNTLRWIFPHLDASQNADITGLLNQFFQNAPAQKIQAALQYWSKEFTPKFLAEHLSVLLPRVIGHDDILRVTYDLADKEAQLKIIQYLITGKPDHGLEFIRSLADTLPDRPEVLRALLTKTESLSPNECALVYTYVNEKLGKNDDGGIKDLAVSQIQKLLKNEDPNTQKVGFDFLTGADFLSIERKREIGKEVIEYLRQPGRNITEQYRYGLKAVASLYESLQETPKHDLVYLLFDSIRQEKGQDAVAVFFEILRELKPTFSDFEKDYQDLLERVRNWPDGDIKTFVVSSLIELKGKPVGKTEKDFWTAVEAILVPPPNPEEGI
jgi:hypothetical protein